MSLSARSGVISDFIQRNYPYFQELTPCLPLYNIRTASRASHNGFPGIFRLRDIAPHMLEISAELRQPFLGNGNTMTMTLDAWIIWENGGKTVFILLRHPRKTYRQSVKTASHQKHKADSAWIVTVCWYGPRCVRAWKKPVALYFPI